MTTWAEVQQRIARAPGSVVLDRFMASRKPRNATYSADVLDAFGALPSSAAGVAVNAASAMRVSAVYACVQRIAGAIASLPLHTYKRTQESRERAESPLWWLLNEQPTGRFTAAAMWEKVIADVLLRGDSFIFIGRTPMGEIKELIPLPHHTVLVQRDDKVLGGNLFYAVNDGGRSFGVDAVDMLHIAGLGFDGVRSMSVIQYAARNATGTAMAMDEYAGRFFQGGAHPSIVLQTDGKMNTDQITRLQSAFAAKYSGVENAHKLPLVLTEGLKAETISLSASDAQLLEARRFQVVDIARAFGVPPHLIGETEKTTSWGSGIESMTRGFVSFTLQPHLIRIEQELNRKFWPQRQKFFVEFNRDALIEGDSAAQAAYFRAALGGPGTGQGWMSVDEIRKIKNLPPAGGDFGEIFDPRSMVPEPTPEPDPEDDPAQKQAAATNNLVGAVMALATREQPSPVVNVTTPDVKVEVAPTDVRVINESPVTNVTTPDIKVDVAQPAIHATIQPPPPPRRVEKIPVRDERGLIVKVIEQEIE